MNPSLLAALASPGAKPASRMAKQRAEKDKENTTAVAGVMTPVANKADRRAARPRAPSFTVPEPPSTPGRMENLRCDEGH